ncbi:MAG TPA: S8 family serine peptidase [Candidatus Krumholzibacteria bacterium]|nr:S8 family serine peptidase [Candidatus Krumholzibacteria bacterium]HPD70372.1 S8 family serine peptidase [Candidatus Krumholzibacteria bacterium]HRY39928.1 S8 family serine peptidase [Candidatus Krumholzibacteria bacterium]
MGARRFTFQPLLWSLVALLAVSGSPRGAAAQVMDYSYPDKLFGGRYSFTVKTDEIMVRLAVAPGAKASVTDAEQLAVAQDLAVVHAEGVEDQGFVVYRTPPGKSAAAAIAALQADSRVALAYPALLNDDGTTRYFLPDQVVVQFAPSLSEADMLAEIARLGSEVVMDHWTPGFFTVSVPAGRDVFDQVRAFNDLASVQFAELSTISFNDHAFVPDDPLYATQWAIHNAGGGGFTADADADVQEAWDIQRGDPGVIVAVIDTGVDWGHPDLQPNILQNLGEDDDGDGQTMVWNGAAWVLDAGDLDGVDNDGNGQVDDLVGWDFNANDNDPYPSGLDAHGTACSGLAAGVADNTTGIAGVANGCRILPLRVNLASGVNQNRADAINYAVGEAPNYSAMVISCSWICSSGSTISVQNAVVAARAAGVLPLFAAGNANGAVQFPANLAAAMAVGASSPCDERKNPASCDGENWWGSNFGVGLSLAAPGVLMQTTDIAGFNGYAGGDYVANFNGTSSACPFTAGAAALVQSEALALTGAALTPNDLQRILEESAEDVGGYVYVDGVSNELGNGRLNVNLAMQQLIAENLVAVLPEPVDLALSIDRSFSMVGDPILAAENAAAQVVRLLDVGDKIAVTSYSGGADPGTLPDWPAWTDFPMTEITGEADKNAAIATIETGGDVYNLTAIGAGLEKARDELHDAVPPQFPQSIILLSDGNNTHPPDPFDVLPLQAPEPTVYTIGFGPFADEVTLEAVAAATGGQYYYAGTSGAKVTGGILPLIQTYQMSLMAATDREGLGWINGQLRQGEHRHEFLVDPSVDQLLIGLLWNYRDPNAFQLILQDPSGHVFDPSSPEWVGDETVSAQRINGPVPGNWLAIVRRVGGGDGQGNYHLNLAASTRVQSILTLTPHGFGQPMLIELALTQLIAQLGPKPIYNAQVTAVITLPNGESFPMALNDAGGNGDQAPNDGVYTGLLTATQYDGSFVVETEASGTTYDNFPFTRYDIATTVLSREEEIPPLPVALPTGVGLPGSILDLPILAAQWVDPLDIVSLHARILFDPLVVQFAGLGDLSGTMMDGWQFNVTNVGNGVVVDAAGAPLQGEGVLMRLKFGIVGALGDISPLVFTELDVKDTAGSPVPVDPGDGSIAVGSSIPDQTPVPYAVVNGWDLRSLPVQLGPGVPLSAQLPAVQQVLGWQGGNYVSTPSPAGGDGMWLQYGGPDSYEVVTGDPLGAYSRGGPAGWYLLGGLFDESAVPLVTPAAAMDGMFAFVESQGYVPVDQIEPGQGVWFHAAEPFTLSVEAGGAKHAARRGAGDKVLAQAVLTATGANLAGVPHVFQVLIGGGAPAPEQLPFPPAPPAYTTLVRLLDADTATTPLYSDLRTDAQMGGSVVLWHLAVQPSGNTGNAGTTLAWNPDALRAIADVAWVLREGLSAGGPVVVADMRDVASLAISGTGERTYTIVLGNPTPVGDDLLPAAFSLVGSYPNPFNPQTTIRFDVPRTSHVQLDVYDVHGRRVVRLVDAMVPAGRQSAIWDGRDDDGAYVPSGVYFSRLTAEGAQHTGRMVLLK